MTRTRRGSFAALFSVFLLMSSLSGIAAAAEYEESPFTEEPEFAEEYGQATVPDDMIAEIPENKERFSVTVPAFLPIAVSETGAVTAAATAQIVNNSAGTVMVTDIRVSGENGWSVVPYSRNMASEKVDSRQIGLKLNNTETEMIGGDNTADLALTDYEWIIEPDAVLPLTYDAVVSANSSPIVGETVLTLYFVVGWALG